MYYTTLLSIIGRINPAVFDVIPRGPQMRYVDGISELATRVSLNPQPLPPREAFLYGAAELAHEIVRTALSIEARGESSLSFVSDIIDEWCGTPWPRKWPLPLPLPLPLPTRGDGANREPSWETLDVQAARVVAAIVFSSFAERLTDDKFSAVFADGAERLVQAAVNGGGQAGRATAKPARATSATKRATRR